MGKTDNKKQPTQKVIALNKLFENNGRLIINTIFFYNNRI